MSLEDLFFEELDFDDELGVLPVVGSNFSASGMQDLVFGLGAGAMSPGAYAWATKNEANLALLKQLGPTEFEKRYNMMVATTPQPSTVYASPTPIIAGTSNTNKEKFVDLQPVARQINSFTSQVPKEIGDKLVPQLDTIMAFLKEAKNQTDATNEHRIIKATEQFRINVLKDLSNISQRLPANHPINRIGNVLRRSLGL